MTNLYDDNYGFYEDGDDPEETLRHQRLIC